MDKKNAYRVKKSLDKKSMYSNNKLLVKKVVYCTNIFNQGTGLMFHTKNSVDNTAWWFKFKKSRVVSITMVFVFFPIDVILLDKNNKVIELKENLLPFRNFTSKNAITSFIELKSGAIKKNSIKKGSIITVK